MPPNKRRSPTIHWQRSGRYFYLRFLRMRSTPDQIARGFALGIFVGMLPTPGLQMAIAVFIASLLKSNKLAAALGTLLTNPITSLPVMALNLMVGQAMLGREGTGLATVMQLRSIEAIGQVGDELLTSYLVGCLVVGLASSVIAYAITRPLLTKLPPLTTQRRLKRWSP